MAVTVDTMPPLPLSVARELRVLDDALLSDLSGTIQYSLTWDESLRTYVSAMYDVYYAFYSQFPEEKKNWMLASCHASGVRVHTLLRSRYSITLDDKVSEAYKEKLLQTVVSYAQRKQLIETVAGPAKRRMEALKPPLQRIEPVIDPPKRPPVLADVATESPLLKMAKSIPFPDPVASRRKAFVQPLLDERGWSITQWAEKAKVSRHTANSYLEGKRKTYHSSMKDLANALGVSFQDFPK